MFGYKQPNIASLVQFAGLLVGGSFRCLLPRRASSRAAFCDLVTDASRLLMIGPCATHNNSFVYLCDPLVSPLMPAVLSAARPPFSWTSLEGRTIIREIVEARLLLSGRMVRKQRKSNAGHTRSRRFRLSLLHRRGGARPQPFMVPF